VFIEGYVFVGKVPIKIKEINIASTVPQIAQRMLLGAIDLQ
jgi:hypothetical protein